MQGCGWPGRRPVHLRNERHEFDVAIAAYLIPDLARRNSTARSLGPGLVSGDVTNYWCTWWADRCRADRSRLRDGAAGRGGDER
jgi:hypothetical protein